MGKINVHSDFTRDRAIGLVHYVQTYFFLSQIGIFLCLSIIQLRFSLIYEHLCPIDDRIVFFLFILALGELIHALLGIFLIGLSFFCEVSPILHRIFVFLFVTDQFLLMILILWILIGNYLVLRVMNQVQSINSYVNQTYCHDRLYRCAVWSVIFDDILLFCYATFYIVFRLQWFYQTIRKRQQTTVTFEEQIVSSKLATRSIKTIESEQLD